ncbi:SNF2-related protein [Chitinimonas sp.]|uniref:DEAD/DEAH box helicase n=1 Tax=Chitinimonas sp. TaxID=1934313 RepID=UPI0035AEAC53
MPTHPTYTRQDVLRWLGSHEVAKGEPYVRRVHNLRWKGLRLLAEVPGSAARPYQVDIVFVPRSHGQMSISAECSCPVAYDCKHSAAVLLAALHTKAAQPQDSVNPEVVRWLDLFRASSAEQQAPAVRKPASHQLFYVLEVDEQGEGNLRFCKGKRGMRLHEPLDYWSNLEGAFRNPISFIGQDDLSILRLVHIQAPSSRLYSSAYPLHGRNDIDLLDRLLQTGRLYLNSSTQGLLGPFAAGEARRANLHWQRDLYGRQQARLQTAPTARLLALSAPRYIDPQQAQVGEVLLTQDWQLMRPLLSLPALGEMDLPLVIDTLRRTLPGEPLPDARPLPVIEGAPQAVLRLISIPVYGLRDYRDYGYLVGRGELDIAVPYFAYGKHRIRPGDTAGHITLEDGQTALLRRDPEQEAHLLKALHKHDLRPLPANKVLASQDMLPDLKGMQALASEQAWPAWVRDALPALKAQGWQIEIDDSFRHWAPEPSAWHAELSDEDNGWAVALAVEVDGQRLPLAPMLAELVGREPRWLQADYRALIGDDSDVMLRSSIGQRLRVAASRIKPLLHALAELFDQNRGGQPLSVSPLDAPRLVEALDAAGDWQNDGFEAARQMAQRLEAAGQLQAVAPPQGLQLTLRPYQLHGLSWLQYLRAQNLGGILADDMGLGKTAQTLAHVLLEKESGRLDRPALIVLPTSLVSNWRHEAARFAPALRVLALHGPQRKADFGKIAEHDLVISTYPLLWRDIEVLGAQEFHLLILDEAQAVKNAGSRSAEAVRQLKARHKLVITGTPMENHLGELWAQFDFLLPGFLGDERAFSRLWRTPIEKHGNGERRALLGKRIKPFILRRRKDEVARDLPPKTIMVREVELQGRQRELYETVRAAMDAKVREAVAGKGFARSQIDILDALLKLRQVCCDPRLLQQDSAREVKEHAKLDALMCMLHELLEEGRRVLVFSQFTSMLALIEAELHKAAIPYVLLTGDTRDRDTPVQRFQAGEVPIFLISLKAGGVGLNLTAADTVIHFDPWWNPAVENQATDRAHRIGQQKPVFVYKLVAAGSIEQRILELQERKAALAAGVLNEDGADTPKFDASDLAALLAPLD